MLWKDDAYFRTKCSAGFLTEKWSNVRGGDVSIIMEGEAHRLSWRASAYRGSRSSRCLPRSPPPAESCTRGCHAGPAAACAARHTETHAGCKDGATADLQSFSFPSPGGICMPCRCSSDSLRWHSWIILIH